MPGTLNVLESVTWSALFLVARNTIYSYGGNSHSVEREMLTNHLVLSQLLLHAAQRDEGSLLGPSSVLRQYQEFKMFSLQTFVV